MTEQQHRATARQWRDVKALGYDIATYSCILELLHRIEALEATQHAHVDLSHLSDAEREKTLKSITNPGRFEALQPAQLAQPNHLEKADSSLVARVAFAITGENGGPMNWRPEARAAIREVAAWLSDQERYGLNWVAVRLEEEAKY